MGVPGGLGERQDAKSVLFRDHMSGQVPKQLLAARRWNRAGREDWERARLDFREPFSRASEFPEPCVASENNPRPELVDAPRRTTLALLESFCSLAHSFERTRVPVFFTRPPP